MKTVKRTRYVCDFCKKTGGHAGHMRRHEERCTMNPQRKCGMCELIENDQLPIAELIATVDADEKSCKNVYDAPEPHNLRQAAGGCPACMLAAIRQHGSAYVDFDYKDESAAVLKVVYRHGDDC